MRAALAAFALAAAMPVAGQAQSIPDNMLRATFDRCVQTCDAGQHSFAFCADLCGCVAGEMGRHWNLAEFRSRTATLAANPEDLAVRTEIGRVVNHCARSRRVLPPG